MRTGHPLAAISLAACYAGPVQPAAERHAPISTVHDESGCPAAAQVLGESQEEDGNRWRIEVGKHLEEARSADRGWLLHETAPPCEAHPVDFDHDDLIVSGTCDPRSEDLEGGTDWVHSPFAIGDTFPECRVARPRPVDDKELAHLAVPDVVRRTMASANTTQTREIRLDVVGNPPVIWEVGSLDYESLDRGETNNNCPYPSWVFVRTRDGIHQLDVHAAVDGALFDRTGLRVVLITPFGSNDNEAYNVTHLPPHRPGFQSQSGAVCMH